MPSDEEYSQGLGSELSTEHYHLYFTHSAYLDTVTSNAKHPRLFITKNPPVKCAALETIIYNREPIPSAHVHSIPVIQLCLSIALWKIMHKLETNIFGVFRMTRKITTTDNNTLTSTSCSHESQYNSQNHQQQN